MKVLFAARAAPFFWILLTVLSLILGARLLGGSLNTLVNFLGTSDFFSPEKFPFLLVPGLEKWTATLVDEGVKSIRFDPRGNLFQVGGVYIPNAAVIIILGGLLFLFFVLVYDRALESRRILDDILVLLLFLFVYGIVADFAELYGFGLLKVGGVRFAAVTILILTGIFLGKPGAMDNLAAFTSALTVVVLYFFLLWPRPTALAFYGLGKMLEGLGTELLKVEPMSSLWYLLGLYCAKIWLDQERRNAPAQRRTFGLPRLRRGAEPLPPGVGEEGWFGGES